MKQVLESGLENEVSWQNRAEEKTASHVGEKSSDSIFNLWAQARWKE
ncbi:MAG: hypothetical protein HFI96_04135 [Lachnospiraceae bacterium]|jgi:hypothetical protein|nr:hypothetical protein [Lachnospiraceae bacterium]MCI9095653.1 hypothetical protein [Lachnospiraceae bacterium]